MIRCFDSDDIQNVNPTVDPIEIYWNNVVWFRA